jgi:hypothetical protein
LSRPGGGELPYIAYTFDIGSGLIARQVQAIHIVGERAHFVTATAPDVSFKKHWEGLKRVLLSYDPGAPESAGASH